jgi:cytosine/adenosine deaminase-related metal-dependent hydrolase
MHIFSAPWIVPVEGPVIRHGSIVVADGRIVALDKREDIVRIYSHFPETRYNCVFMPGLVNAHMHLELSHLQPRSCLQPEEKFTDWINTLIERRLEEKKCPERIVASFRTALLDQYRLGVVLLGDIGNEYFDELHSQEEVLRPHVIRMLEFLGPNHDVCRTVLENLACLDERISATGHAPYSTAPELLVEIKKRCNRLGHVFSIHTAESVDEREFVRSGGGSFHDFLKMRNSWDGVFSIFSSGFSGTIEYFDHLGILDEKTLLVHCVHVSDREIRLIKERGSDVCLCPGSNQFLGVGFAPVEQMVAIGLLPALGTDSSASNETIDIWREMAILGRCHPGLEAVTILTMATLGGARVLGCGADYGGLAIGKRAEFLHVSSNALQRCRDGRQLVKELVSGGIPAEISWVSADHE